ncbi:MAG: ATP synthase F1 subunit delta [Thermoanaerobaculales bacterium]|nr:ATP synthase F1 subunit delta [Thermoanaerobaculales bacterium]
MAGFRAAPYAKALFDTAADARTAEEMVRPVEQVAEVVVSVPELLRVMVTPLVSQEAKTSILDAVLDALGTEHVVRRFIHVVQRHYRLEHMEKIAKTYRDVVDRALGRVHARVETPGPLSEAARATLLDAMKKVVAAEVVADFVERPELLAGFRVQVGSRVFDGSLDGQLQQLGRERK